MRDVARRHRLLTFGVLAYAWTWAWWVPIALRHDVVRPGHASPTQLPGLLGPMLAAFVTTALADGASGLRDLARRMLRFRVDAAHWALVVGSLLTLLAISAPIESGFTWSHLGEFSGVGRIGPIGVLVVLVVVNGIGEETGWRGFAYAQLRNRHDEVTASLRTAALWAGWHTPLFVMLQTYRDFNPFTLIGFGIGIASGAVVLGALYERSNGSILVAAIWHGGYNFVAATGDSAVRSSVASALVIAWAVLIVRAHQPDRIRKEHGAWKKPPSVIQPT